VPAILPAATVNNQDSGAMRISGGGEERRLAASNQQLARAVIDTWLGVDRDSSCR
jgi:hypothetical protein